MFRLLKTYIVIVIINYMKLQKRLSRKYKDKAYYKYIVVLKEIDVKSAGFKEGEELGVEVRNGEIKLKKE